MVDVSDKAVTVRTAKAEGFIVLRPDVYDAVKSGAMKKGDVLAVAQLAGITGAKETGRLIPLCHPLALSKIAVVCDLLDDRCAVRVRSEVKTEGKTGVEMEALTAVQIALLTVYDMCKSAGHEMEIGPVYLVEKTGGKHGRIERDSQHRVEWDGRI